MLESLGIVVARLALNLAPIRRPRRATVTAAIVVAGAWTPAGSAAAAVAAVVELAAVWHPIPGTRPSAAAIFVVGATAIAAAFTVVTAAAIAAAAPLAAKRAIAVHASQSTSNSTITVTEVAKALQIRKRLRASLKLFVQLY